MAATKLSVVSGRSLAKAKPRVKIDDPLRVKASRGNSLPSAQNIGVKARTMPASQTAGRSISVTGA